MRERARRRARAVLSASFAEVIPDAIDRQIRDEFNILLPRQVMLPGAYP